MMHFFGAFKSLLKQHFPLESPIASLSSTRLNQKKQHFPPGLGTTMWADGHFSGYGSHQTAAKGVGKASWMLDQWWTQRCFEKPLAAMFVDQQKTKVIT